MCEYCGCQSLRAVDELTREHDVALDHIRLARRALASGETATVVAACAALDRLLAPHTAVEEEGLFPAMAREHPAHVEVLLDEHRRVESALAEVREAGARADGWEARLERALVVLREHIAKEQDGLFPAALTTLSGADWDAVEAVRARVGSALGVAAQA